jgi:hypothetical protein
MLFRSFNNFLSSFPIRFSFLFVQTSVTFFYIRKIFKMLLNITTALGYVYSLALGTFLITPYVTSNAND